MICDDGRISDDHDQVIQKIICASNKCNNGTVRCPVQYRLLHCKLRDIWWLQELESWWKGPKGIDAPPLHNNIFPDAVDKNPAMHSKYKEIINSMYDEDPRRPKQLIYPHYHFNNFF